MFDGFMLQISLAMKKKVKISYRKGVHRGEERLLLDIPYDKDIIEKIKMIPGRKWSKTKNCWHVPDNQESMRYINRLMELYPATVAKTQSPGDKIFSKDDKPQPRADTNRGKKSASGPETVYLTITPKKLFLQMAAEANDIKFVRRLRYARWNNNTYQWEITAHPENLTMLQNYFGKRLI